MPAAAVPPRSLRRAAQISLVLVLALIFIGGLVRATGAGLGCPDWPRCWGAWWPPSAAADIDLERINRDKIPAEFREAPDPRVFFNQEKMWIEYLNRLWGVLSGLAVLVLFVIAARHARAFPVVFSGASATLVLMLFQGWLGALVVRSGLEQQMITLHMAVALVILGLLVFTRFHARGGHGAGLPPETRRRTARLALLLLGLTVVQILGGTEVRAALDHVADHRPDLPRGEWLATIGWIDHFHRLFSWTVLAAALGLVFQTRRQAAALAGQAALILGLVLGQLALGVSLAWFALPPASQFLHLGLAAALAAALFHLWLVSKAAAPPA
jgi:heme a synthase